MNCHYLIYKPIRSSTPYEAYIKKEKAKQLVEKKDLFYKEILKFKSSRYPQEYMDQLENDINPFEHSLETFKQIISSKFPEYSEDIINESVEYVFNKKSKEASMIKESAFIIEDGEEFIRNGRRLMKEDFTYSFSKLENLSMISDSILKKSMSDLGMRNKSGSITKRDHGNASYHSPPKFKEDEGALSGMSKSPQKSHTNEHYLKNQIFNEIIAQEIKREKMKHNSIEVIHEDDPEELIAKEEIMRKQIGFTDRSRTGLNTSFPNFKERDVIVPAEGMETGRSEMEELNFLLSEVSMIGDNKGGSTSRISRGQPYSVRIKKENMDNLYNAQGNLKIDLIKRAVGRMKKNESFEKNS